MSMRASWWDYSGNGAYFITLICKKRIQHLGKINEQEMMTSPSGLIVEQVWLEMSQHFPYVQIDKFVVMPDHFHGIIIFNKHKVDNPIPLLEVKVKTGGVTGNANPMLHENLSMVIRWFKGRTTFEIRKINPLFKWEKNFYEKIIRNKVHMTNTQKYIETNPMNWKRT